MKKFTEYLDDFSFDDLVALWNEYASDTGDGAYVFDSIEDFADNYEPDALELAHKVFFGDVKSWSDMVYLNGYGNFESCWNVDNSPIDLDELAKWMRETNHDVFTEWKEAQPTFEEWLEDTYNKTELLALWGEYMEEDYQGDDILGFDLVVLGSEIEEADGDEYIDYLKEVFE